MISYIFILNQNILSLSLWFLSNTTISLKNNYLAFFFAHIFFDETRNFPITFVSFLYRPTWALLRNVLTSLFCWMCQLSRPCTVYQSPNLLQMSDVGIEPQTFPLFFNMTDLRSSILNLFYIDKLIFSRDTKKCFPFY